MLFFLSIIAVMFIHFFLADENATVLNTTEALPLGCPSSQEWCLSTPAMTISQLILGFVFTSIGYPIGITLILTIFSKVLGPRPQVRYKDYLIFFFFYFLNRSVAFLSSGRKSE